MDGTSWLKLLGAIHLAKVELKCELSGAWYRGVTSYRHRLYPSLLRPRARIPRGRERSIFEDAEDFEADAAHTMSSWERLVKLQHHGIPTRLLDWTEVFGVALYFALGGGSGTQPKSPAIWVLNPFRLAQLARNNNDKSIGAFHRDSNSDYFVHFLQGAQLTWPFDAPMPYRPPKLTPRVRSQRGFFTVHGTDVRPIDAIYGECVRQVRIPSAAIQCATQFLELSESTAFRCFQTQPSHS